MKPVSARPYILYAEDDLDDFESMQGALQQETDKYEIIRAKHGEEVISLLNETETPPKLIVLDLNMPVMGGIETLQWLKEQRDYKEIPVMVFTTSSREEDIRFCQGHGCTFYRKPTLYRDLLHIVQTMVKMGD